ncbi:DUF2274 domain-containing protein [Pigmentiphaga sp.]|uniref:DUF2274 domain-containing protein n=1 Tax=Pigmentiphaga sp. TaxID=1977564 RepID=UPI0025F8BF28|nr:DUF2274 domain-containing protein [Pigmentiphaga sp.]
MSKPNALSLGALPSTHPVKLTLAVPADLKAQLDAYAEAHSRLHGPVDTATLIPHMLAAFIARDRGFRALQTKSVRSKAYGATSPDSNPAGHAPR